MAPTAVNKTESNLIMFVAFFQLLIKLYSLFISPLLGTNCRYQPTCSEYSHQAFERFGVYKGCYLTVRRLCKCHPWGGSGYDPVPEKRQCCEKDDKST